MTTTPKFLIELAGNVPPPRFYGEGIPAEAGRWFEALCQAWPEAGKRYLRSPHYFRAINHLEKAETDAQRAAIIRGMAEQITVHDPEARAEIAAWLQSRAQERREAEDATP